METAWRFYSNIIFPLVFLFIWLVFVLPHIFTLYYILKKQKLNTHFETDYRQTNCLLSSRLLDILVTLNKLLFFSIVLVAVKVLGRKNIPIYAERF